MEISRQSISLLISAKDMKDFKSAAKYIIHDFCEGYEGIREQNDEEVVNRIYEYVNEHFTEYDISIEKVAETLHVSTEMIRQAILKRTGKMYREYLIWLRIEYAKVLLRQKELSVSECCQKVGYGNVSYFIKLFREMTGVTPAKFRKNAIEIEKQ